MTATVTEVLDDPKIELPPSAADEGHPRRRIILAVLATVAFMAQLDLFIVNIAVPAMGRSFAGASLSDLSWVLNAYAIVFAALLVPAGRLADHFGRRRFLLSGVVIFTLASVWCGLAPNLPTLVGGRVLQAVGAAMIVPTSLGLLFPSYPKRLHGLVVGIWSGVAAIAASSGAPIGGVLVGISWRWIFFVNLPLGIATVVVGRRVLPEIRADRGTRLPDPFSAVTVFSAIALLTLATVEGPRWGWTSASEVTIAAVAAVAIVAAVRRTLRHPHAVIEKGLFESRQFTTASIGLFALYLGFAAWLLVTVLFLQEEWGYSPLRAGLAIAPGPLVAAAFSINSARIGARFGRRAVAVVGPLFIAAAGIFWIVAAHPAASYGTRFLPGMILGGIGVGLAQAPLFAATSTLPEHRATTGSAVLNMSRQVASAFGVATTVVLVGAIHRGSVADFQRCWWFVVATVTAASIISAVGGRSRPADA